MDDFKSLFASKTFWGGALAVGASVLGLFGYELGGQDRAAIIEDGSAIAAAVGGVIAIWGRVKASKIIK